MSQPNLVQAEVDEPTKTLAEKWLEEQGISPEEAIRIFYREVIASRGLPFGDARRRNEEFPAEATGEAVFYGDVPAVDIRSVTVELRQTHLQGREMLAMLKDFREERAARKAARKAKRNAEAEAGGMHAEPHAC